jgi:hypothetical protein
MKSFLLTGLLIIISTSSFAQGVYDANFRPLNFNSNGTNKQIRISGNSTSSGAQFLYTNVITINGQQIDCRVTYTSSNSQALNTFDVGNSRTNAFEQVLDNMFVPTLNRADESFFTFEFGEAVVTTSGGTTTVTSFYPLVLQNFYLNVYDIDNHTQQSRSAGARNNNRDQLKIYSNNYSNFTTFDSTSASISTTLNSTRNTVTNNNQIFFNNIQFDDNNSLLRNLETNYSLLIDSRHRARITFNSTSTVRLSYSFIDNQSNATTTAYFDFSAGYTSSRLTLGDVVNPANVVAIDLDRTSSTKENTYSVMTTNSAKSITDGTGSSKINIVGNQTARFQQLDINVFNTKDNTSSISREKFLVTASTNRTINFNTTVSDVFFTIGSNHYRAEINSANATAGSASIEISRRNNNSTISGNSSRVDMTLSNVDEVLDALRFINEASTPTIGSRIIEFQVYVNDINVNNTITNINSFISPSFFVADFGTVLPVDLISFTGLAKTEGNQLNWTVAQEVDFSHYEVLRSTNGKEFAKIGEVYPENKSTEMKNYSFLDASVKADLAYYKLNLINEDGSSSYSNLVVINRTVVAPVITKLYPNPATTTLLVSLEGVDAEVSTITIHDLSGKVVYTTETSDVATLLNINELNKGMYIVKVASQSGFVSVSRFIKN